MVPVKIMFLVDYYENPQAGTEGQLRQLIQNLDSSRFEAAMTVFRKSQYIENMQFPCPVSILNISKLASFRTVIKIVRYVLNLRQQGYRLVHCYFNDSSLIAPFFLKLAGIHVVVSRRDMGFWYTPYNLMILRAISPFVNCYVANSYAVKNLVHNREWINQSKIAVIYNGYAPSNEDHQKLTGSIELFGIPKNARIVGIVANLRPIKRLDTLLEAFIIAYLKCPDIYLMIIGDKDSAQAASTFDELNKLARESSITERIIFTGKLENPRPYINQFAVAVLCSESEGFSNSIIEYLQAGRPVICTDTGGNSEIIQNNFNGYLIPVGNSHLLAERLVTLLRNDTLALQMSKNGYETVRKFTHFRMVDEQMLCYDKVMTTNCLSY